MNDLVKYEQGEMVITRDPEEVLEEARRAAQALTRVIEAKPKKVTINGQQYLELADWELLGKFYGLTGKITETKPVQFGNVRGWEAHAVVLDRAGREISAADGMCLNDEEKWSSKPKYEYFYLLKDGTKQKDPPPKSEIIWIDNLNSPGKKMPKKERVKVADEPVPFFQLRSMAQTRALSKSMGNVLRWVVVLAGYKSVSVDEMGNGEEFEPEEEKGAPSSGSSVPPPAEGQAAKDEKITEEQQKTIFTQLKKKNLPLEHLEGYLSKAVGTFTHADLNSALEWIGKQKAVN